MPQMIFVNLPITDVKRSRRFYEALGYRINEQFSDETTACVVVSDTIYFMILEQERFKSFLTGPMGDPAKATAVLMALSQDSRDAVDAFAATALSHGGSEPKAPTDMGFMYNRTICDPDGNTFEPFWMDPAAAAGG
ncbi:MAG: VOC family protein [Paracoccaceae bacterium]